MSSICGARRVHASVWRWVRACAERGRKGGDQRKHNQQTSRMISSDVLPNFEITSCKHKDTGSAERANHQCPLPPSGWPRPCLITVCRVCCVLACPCKLNTLLHWGRLSPMGRWQALLLALLLAASTCALSPPAARARRVFSFRSAAQRGAIARAGRVEPEALPSGGGHAGALRARACGDGAQIRLCPCASSSTHMQAALH